MSEDEIADLKAEEKARLNKRLDSIGWALFLIMIGGIALVGDETVPEGTWSIGVGLIWIGMNLTRYLNGIKVSGFTLVLGIIALLTGIGDLLGANFPVLGIVLILIGASIIFRLFFERKND